MVGGGSNLLVGDEGFGGVVVRDLRRGITVDAEDSCGARVSTPRQVGLGRARGAAVAEEWVGVEALSGIPGTVGAAPVQNIGAYGQDVAGAVSTVRVWDRARSRVRTLALGELAFGYRTSLLKRSMHVDAGTGSDDDGPWYPSPRYVVLDVGFHARLGSLSAPVAYPSWHARSASRSGTARRAQTCAPRCSLCARARACCSTASTPRRGPTTTVGAPGRSSRTLSFRPSRRTCSRPRPRGTRSARRRRPGRPARASARSTRRS